MERYYYGKVLRKLGILGSMFVLSGRVGVCKVEWICVYVLFYKLRGKVE